MKGSPEQIQTVKWGERKCGGEEEKQQLEFEITEDVMRCWATEQHLVVPWPNTSGA